MITEDDTRDLPSGLLATCQHTDRPTCGWKGGGLLEAGPCRPSPAQLRTIAKWDLEATQHARSTGHDVAVVRIGRTITWGGPRG